MTENWPKKRWIVYKCEDTRLVVKNDSQDRNAKEVLIELYLPFSIVQCLDYTTGKELSNSRLDVIYDVPEKES